MAIRDVYTDLEKEMIAKTEETADKLVGWSTSSKSPATAESLKNNAATFDPWNPIWRDEDYARNTRWGRITAFPTYEYAFGSMMFGPSIPDDGSFEYQAYVGEDWEIFRPVRPGDSIRVWNRRPQIKDVTPLDGSKPRVLAIQARDADYINQNDELVSTLNLYLESIIYPEVPKPYSMPEYGYTQEELEYIDHIAREEEIRGTKIRYWEDVNLNDTIKPTVLGPTSSGAGGGMSRGDMPVPARQILRKAGSSQSGGDFLPGPDGRFYTHAGRHASDRSAQAQGEPKGWLFGAASKNAMIRCVTNWMGNDGFIKKLRWRHLARIAIGDTIIDTGKVTGKRIEDGEHLVDLLIWGRNMRGNITEASTFTVCLLSKEESRPFKWK